MVCRGSRPKHAQIWLDIATETYRACETSVQLGFHSPPHRISRTHEAKQLDRRLALTKQLAQRQAQTRVQCSAKAGHSRYRGVAEVLRHRSWPPLAIAIIARPCRGLSLPFSDCCIQYYPSRQTPLAPLALAAAPVSPAGLLCSALNAPSSLHHDDSHVRHHCLLCSRDAAPSLLGPPPRPPPRTFYHPHPLPRLVFRSAGCEHRIHSCTTQPLT